MIDIQNIKKSFERQTVLENVSFQCGDNELITLLGPNGAGKTTLMRILTGILLPDDGKILFNNRTYSQNRLPILQQIGYLPENIPLYDELSPFEYLKFIGQIYKLPEQKFNNILSEIIAEFEIEKVMNQKIGTLSKGYKRRIGLAAAILHQPKILILDEPTEGLDPNQKIKIRIFLKQYAKNNFVMISTHLLEEAEELNARMIILNHGKKIYDGHAQNLKDKVGNHSLSSAFYHLTQENYEEQNNVESPL